MARIVPNKLKDAPEKTRQNWADKNIGFISDRHVLALDIAGWKIVRKDGGNHLWPFSSKATKCDCPDWCHDVDDVVGPTAKVLPFYDPPPD